MNKLFNLTLIILLLSASYSDACTNLLVTKGASADGSTFITYNADAGGFMDPLYFKPAKDHQPRTMLEIFDWDSGKYLGKIKQAQHTYSVIGNMNENQVSIGETTFTGRIELKDSTGLIDYGSLMWLALHRAKTAREAIKVMTDLVAEYGYYSSGESFSIADPNEVWIMDMIGKGPGNTGAVWVAMRVPDGYISAHANESRIRNFPLNDPENCLYAKDVISFAKEKGFYKDSDGPFNFTDTYSPKDPGSRFYCAGRVWSLFSRANPQLNLSPDYFRAVKDADPYPLWIKPAKKLSVKDVIDLMRDHFEGTEFDMTKGLAAGPFGVPYRWKNLGWKISDDSTQYGWGRPISTQQTAFTFVSQMRSFMPDEIGGCFWYGVDDNYQTVYMPLYCSMTAAPESYTSGSIAEFSLNSAFWVFNLVSNLAYTKYSYAIEDVQKVQNELESKFLAFQPSVEKAALELYQKDKALAVQYLTEYSVNTAENTLVRWRKLWEYMVVKYNDGYINDVEKSNGRAPKGVGYGDDYLKEVIKQRPGFYEIKWK